MVNIIENWANIKGTVIEIKDNPEIPEYNLIKVKLEKASDVKGFPNLATLDEGKIIHINIRKAEVKIRILY